MLRINSDEEISNIISENEIVILYFSNKVCGTCEMIKSKIERIYKTT